jgi:hypothetical protein
MTGRVMTRPDCRDQGPAHDRGTSRGRGNRGKSLAGHLSSCQLTARVILSSREASDREEVPWWPRSQSASADVMTQKVRSLADDRGNESE